jgi:hypothetical protein
MDMILPEIGLIETEDSETGEKKWIDTDNEIVRQDYHNNFFAGQKHVKIFFTKAGCDLLHIRTDEDYVKVLQKFFISRN